MNELISIIVPVYNAERYLLRCLNSIKAQIYVNFEIILVDDGSKDNSGKICDDYCQDDNRFHAIHQENKGVSIARQVGLEASSGEYVIHVDPDDWIEPQMLQRLYSKINSTNADMVICDYFVNQKNYQSRVHLNIENLEAKEVLKSLLKGNIHGNCWNKLVRRELFKKYNVGFPEGLTSWEDLFVNCNLLLHDIKIAYLNEAFYHYDQFTNSNGLARHPSRACLESQISFCKYFGEILDPELVPYLFYCKLITKSLAVDSRYYTLEQSKELFSEINPRFVEESKHQYLFPHERLLRDYILGKPAWLINVRYQLSMLVYKCRISISRFVRAICPRFQ